MNTLFMMLPFFLVLIIAWVVIQKVITLFLVFMSCCLFIIGWSISNRIVRMMVSDTILVSYIAIIPAFILIMFISGRFAKATDLPLPYLTVARVITVLICVPFIAGFVERVIAEYQLY